MTRKPLTLPQLSHVFRQACAESRHTMKEVLEYAGIPQQYPSKWEKNQGRAPYYYEVALAAEMLEKPVDFFIYESGEDEFIHIPKEEFKNIMKELNQQLNAIGESTSKVRGSRLYKYYSDV